LSTPSTTIWQQLTFIKAMAGGAGMILTPSTIMPMVSLGFLSKDGKCYTFDSRANGYGRGEGVGIVVLKRLSDAIRDNDTIRGVIRGTSTNQDGRTSGITMPSSEAQVVNIRKCYAAAGLGSDKTMFVECHGTGTQAGDPRELKAISDALCNERPADKPMLVGSIKTNIGHLEGSAGVAGVIKAVMTIEKGRIPRHINFQSWNPDIDHRRLKVNIPLENTPWPSEGLRRISVNSFGFGGSNAHAIIDDAAHYLEQEVGVVAHHNTRPSSAEDLDADSMDVDLDGNLGAAPYLFVFSANNQGGVARIADAHLSYLTDRTLQPSSMRDYAYTLYSRRSKLQYKSFAVARSSEELVSEIASFKTSQPHRSQKSRGLNLAFVFCGQGAQWSTMGMDLCSFDPFRDSLEESSALLRKLDPNFDLLAALVEDANQESAPEINNPVYAQPATTAVQIALVDLLTACGVKVTAVVGHSSGEIAACYAAGMMSKLGALTVAYFRGKVASHVQSKGSMLAVSLSSTDAQKYVDAARQGSVCIACINSPESVTLSGDTDKIRQIQDSLDRDGIANKLLMVETAYHSHHMRTVSDEYQAMLNVYLPKSAAEYDGPAMFSSVTGQRVCHGDLGPSYWVNNMVSPVEFEKAVCTMIKAEKDIRPDIFLEVSPHSVLRKALCEIMANTATGDSKAEIPYFSMMVRKKDGAVTALNTLGELWARGLPIQLDWLHQKPSQSKPKCLVDLPTYPWDHSKTYWHESHLSKAHRFRKFGSHDFLGAMTADSITPQEPRWRGFIDITENPWIEHHKIQKKIMYPAAGMVVMAVEAAKQVVDGAVDSHSDILDFEVSDLKIEEPMVVPESETRLEYNFNATRIEESTADRVSTWRYSFTIYSLLDTSSAPPHQHIANARGFFAVRFKPRGLEQANGATGRPSLDENLKGHRASSAPVDFANGMNPREFYERLNIIGLNYGRLFRNITTMSPAREVPESPSTKSCWTKVQIPNTKVVMPEEYETPSTIHPATLDAMFQSLFVLGDEPMVPHYIESIRISADAPQGAGTEFLGYSEAKRKGKREAVSDIVMWHGEDRERPIVSIRGLSVITMAAPGKAIPDFLPDNRNLCSQIVWKEDVRGDRYPDAASGSRTFEAMLELMGHRFPGMRVLQVGGERSVVSFVLQILASETTPRLGNYLILDEKEDVFQAAQEGTAKGLRSLLLYEQLVDKYSLADTLKQQKFDLVLADSRLGIDRGVLIQVLKPTGILAFTHKGLATNGVSGQDGVLSGHFARITEQHDWVPSSWYSLPQTYPAKMSTETVVILTDDDPPPESRIPSTAAALVSRLQSAGMGLEVKTMDLAELRAVLNHETPDGMDAYVISLIELNSSEDIVYDIDAQHYRVIQTLFQKTNKGLLWVTAGAQMDTQLPTKSPFLGWARTVRSEEPDRHIVCLDLEVVNPAKRQRTAKKKAGDAGIEDSVSAICDVFFRSFASTVPIAARDVEFAQRGGRLYIPRLESLKEVNKLIEEGLDQEKIVYEVHSDKTKPLRLVRGASGAFEDVYFKEDPDTNRDLQPHEVLIDVQECYLIPDLLDIPSQETEQPGYRTDVWGTVAKVGKDVTELSSGQTVLAIDCGAVASRVIADQHFVWEESLPTTSITHSPTCLITASFCLRVVNKGAKVLIHGAAGPYSQAAIQIAWNRGADVFAVVSGEDQRKALVGGGVLDDEHILDGGDGLPERVASVSGSRGMDFIFNPTTRHRDLDFRMVRPYGQVIHLARTGSTSAGGDVPSTGCFQLKVFDFVTLREHCPERVVEHFDIIRDLSRASIQEPVLKQSYSFGHVRTAFKDLHSNPYSGVRMLRRIQKQKVYGERKLRTEQTEMLPFARIPGDVYPAPRLSWSATYIVAGGLGGLGLDVVKWLAKRGARHVMIFSRSANHGQTTQDYLDTLRERGTQITVMELDICDWNACSAALKAISTGRSIAGIIQAAAVIKVRFITFYTGMQQN
jgi:acyl transferase domain-containing protein/NADPH:quinone reductase-like Zn-dependent oxidoreductase